MSGDTVPTDPRKYARARAVGRRFRDLFDSLDAAVEWEETAEVLTRRKVEARAAVEEAQRKAAAVESEVAARRTKLDAAADQERDGLLQENERLKRENAELRAEQAALKDDVAAEQREHRRLADLNAGSRASLATVARS